MNWRERGWVGLTSKNHTFTPPHPPDASVCFLFLRRHFNLANPLPSPPLSVTFECLR